MVHTVPWTVSARLRTCTAGVLPAYFRRCSARFLSFFFARPPARPPARPRLWGITLEHCIVLRDRHFNFIIVKDVWNRIEFECVDVYWPTVGWEFAPPADFKWNLRQ